MYATLMTTAELQQRFFYKGLFKRKSVLRSCVSFKKPLDCKMQSK